MVQKCMLTEKVETQRFGLGQVTNLGFQLSLCSSSKSSYSAVRFTDILRLWLITSPRLASSKPQRLQTLEDSQQRWEHSSLFIESILLSASLYWENSSLSIESVSLSQLRASASLNWEHPPRSLYSEHPPLSIQSIRLSLLRASASLYWEHPPLSIESIRLSLLRASVSLYWEHKPVSIEGISLSLLRASAHLSMADLFEQFPLIKTWKILVHILNCRYRQNVVKRVCSISGESRVDMNIRNLTCIPYVYSMLASSRIITTS